MPRYAYTKSVEDALSDLHQGLHFAMDKLILEKNYAEAERVLKIVDERIAKLINQAMTTEAFAKDKS